MTHDEPPSSNKVLKPNELPHYWGHRNRLRQRFMESNGENFPDYELMELLLMLSQPRKDMKPLAKQLIKTFGSFAGALTAPPERLLKIKGCGETTLAVFKMVQVAAQHLAREDIMNKPIMNAWRRVIEYCQMVMGHEQIEQFRVLFLNQKYTLIEDEILQRGTVNAAHIYPREIIKRALEVSASGLVLVHNHPSGDPTPSKQDVELTRFIQRAAAPLDIEVVDHLIIGRNGHTSLRSLKLMDETLNKDPMK